MDVDFSLQGIRFEWNTDKADSNLWKHGVSFERACEVFFDPFIVPLEDDLLDNELRGVIIGLTVSWKMLLSSTRCEMKSFASFLLAQPLVRNDYAMKTNDLKQRLQKNRTMTMISLRIPEDVVADLKRVAPMLGFSGYQPLIRAYIGQGLRTDLERLEGNSSVAFLLSNLRKQGVSEEILATAVTDLREQGPTYE